MTATPFVWCPYGHGPMLYAPATNELACTDPSCTYADGVTATLQIIGWAAPKLILPWTNADEPAREPLPLYMGGSEPILGWRIWACVFPEPPTRRFSVRSSRAVGIVMPDVLTGAEEAPRLASVGQPVTWPPREALAAKCLRSNPLQDEHRAPFPDAGCACGVWAFNHPAHVDTALAMYADRYEIWAMGLVKLWGRVVEHERGWRGEYAYPHSFQLRSTHPSSCMHELAQRLERSYGVPVAVSDVPIMSTRPTITTIPRTIAALGASTQQAQQATQTFAAAMQQFQQGTAALARMARRAKWASRLAFLGAAFQLFAAVAADIPGLRIVYLVAATLLTWLGIAEHRRWRRLTED